MYYITDFIRYDLIPDSNISMNCHWETNLMFKKEIVYWIPIRLKKVLFLKTLLGIIIFLKQIFRLSVSSKTVTAVAIYVKLSYIIFLF